MRVTGPLVPRTLEQKLRGWGAYSKKEDGWHSALLRGDQSLTVDLRDVTFAEFEALALVLILVESAVRHRIDTRVILPAITASEAEFEALNSSAIPAQRRRRAEEVRYRRAAHTFMDHVGFTRALGLPHITFAPDVLTVQNPGQEEGEPEPLEPEDERINDAVRDLARPLSVLPFRWFGADDEDDSDIWTAQVAQVLARAEDSLDEADAQKIARGILWELIENVRLHAGHLDSGEAPPSALLGAVVLNTSRGHRYSPRPEQFLESVAPYVDWVRERPSRVFRAIVADGGSGIERTLSGPALQQTSLHGLPQLHPPLTEVERILFWSFSPLSTRLQQPRLGVRGLALVDRFARAYSGMVTIRSGDAAIGYVNIGSRRVGVREQGLRSVPGSLISITALGSEARNRRTRREWRSTGRAAHPVIVLDGNELLTTDRLTLGADERLAKEEGEPTVVVVCSDDVLKTRSPLEVANQLSRLAVGLSTRCGRVALAVADSAIESIAPYLKAYEDAWEVEGSSAQEEAVLRALQVPTIPDPLLVLGAAGEATWWGGRAEVRLLLFALLESADGQLARHEVMKLLGDAGSALHGPFLSDWVHVDDEVVSLAVSPAWIEVALQGEGLNRLRADVGCSFRDSGPTTTASLERVPGWVDVSTLLQNRVTMGLIAQTVARLVQGVIPPEANRMIVAYADPVLSDLSALVALRLGAATDMVVVNGPIDQVTRSETPSPGVVCVFLNGLAHTGSTAAVGVRQLLKERFAVGALVSIVDASEHGIPYLECLSRRLPHLSALAWPIKPIDRPFVDLSRRRQAEHGEALTALDLLEKSTRCLDIGHVVGAGGRHFSCYVHPEPFQVGAVFLEDTLAELARMLQETFGTLAPNSSRVNVELWYPDDDPDLVGVAVGRFLALLKAARVGAVARPVKRAGHPGSLIDARDKHVVVFDWGAVTSRTVAHLMVTAARLGARTVVGAVLLSQLAPSERDLMTSVLALNGETPAKPRQPSIFETLEDASGTAKPKPRAVPTVYVEATHLALPRWDEQRACELCRASEEFRRLVAAAPTEVLQRRAEERIHRLGLLTRRERWAADAVDYQGAPIRSEEVADALREYLDLQLASRDRDFAVGLRAELESLNKGSIISPRDLAIVRGVLLDPGVLKSGYLRVPSIRAALAGVALRLLRDRARATLGIATQAIAVLRMSSKFHFLGAAAEITRKQGQEVNVAAELLLAALSLIRRDYQQTPAALAPARDTLQEIVEFCRADASMPLEITRSATAVLLETEFRIASSDLPTLTAATACRRLKQLFDEDIVRHHGVGAKGQGVFQALHGLRVSTALELVTILGAGHWEKALEDWKVCRQFVVHQVLPRVSFLWSALNLPLGTGSVDLLPADLGRLERLLVPENVHSIGKLDELIATLHRSPDLMHSGTLDDAREEFDWWFEVFLRSPAGQETARLFAALEACHTSLDAPLDQLEEHAKIADGSVVLRIESTLPGCEVFCRRALLEEVLAELVLNADRHRAEDLPPKLNLHVGRHSETQIRIRAAYAGTSPTEGLIPGRGSGLTDARLFLAAFDGEMRWGTTEEAEGPWPEGTSFGVVLDLIDWGAT